ncbi:unnamed protein product [Calypogeia fissa]
MASDGRRGKRRTERRNETLEGSYGRRRHRVTDRDGVTERFVVGSTEDGKTDLRKTGSRRKGRRRRFWTYGRPVGVSLLRMVSPRAGGGCTKRKRNNSTP